MKALLRIAFPILVLGAAAAAHGQSAARDRQANLGRKQDAGGPSRDLAGDVTRSRSELEGGPGVDYDRFRFTVELQLKEKRAELMNTFSTMVRLGGDNAKKPDLLFRLAELNWEESRYWFFEANRQEEKALLCKEEKNLSCHDRAMAEKKEFLAKSEQYQQEAIRRYEELIVGHKDYARLDEVLFFLGHNYWEAGKHKESLAAYKRLIQHFPQSKYVPDAWLAFGEWYFSESAGKRDMLQMALEAYSKAAEYKESPVYGFAVYKQGWCLYNLSDYPGAADKFKTTVHIGELAQNVANQNKTTLIREARKDFVLAYSHYGDPTRAKEAFIQVGGKENWWSMLVSLADLYYGQGKDKEAVLVYRQLIRERPLSPEAPLYQSRIVDAVMRVGHKPITVEQARLLVKVFQDVEKSGVIKTDADRKKLEEARDLSERTLSNLAVTWHNEGKKSRDEPTFEYSSAVYMDYLQLFADSPKAYDLRFFHAELLYEHLHKFDHAAVEYERVADVDIAKIEEAKKLEAEGKAKEAAELKPGKWMVKALEGAIYAHDETVKKLGDEPLPKDADPKKPLPIPEPKQKLVRAIERYLEYVPEGDKRVEAAYKAAQIHYRYNHFEPAVKAFSTIALEHPDHSLATYSANLVLDSYNLLEDYEKIDEWAKRFHGEPRLAKGPFKAELEKIIERNSFKLVAQLEKQERFAEAGERYLKFVAEWPRSDLADEALFNAAVDFHKGGRPERAIEVRERLVREYPKSDLAPEAAYGIAAQYDEMADFQRAAEGYERYAASWEKQKTPPRRRGRRAKPAPAGPKYDEAKAKTALHNAGIYREALGQYASARKNREAWLRNWPRDPEAASVFLSIADLHEKSGNTNAALRHLERYLKDHARRNVERKLIALGRMAKLYGQRGSRTWQNRMYDEIWRTWRSVGPQRRKQLAESSPQAIEAVATAHFAQTEPEWTAYQRIRIRLPQEAMARALQEKGQRLLALEKRYTETVSLGAASPGICALSRIGLAYRNFATALYDAPVPRGLNEEQVILYKNALAEQAMPVEAKAREGLTVAVLKARELGVSNDCAKEALSVLEEIAPDQFPKLGEEPAPIRIAAQRQGLGLLSAVQPIPPPPPADAEVPDVVERKLPTPASAEPAEPGRRSATSPVYEAPLQRQEGEPYDEDLLP